MKRCVRLVALTLAALCSSVAQPGWARETLTLQAERMPEERAWFGVAEAVNQATLSAQTSGRVKELPFDVQDYVPAGAVVVRFTDDEQQAHLRSAQAGLAAAQAQAVQAGNDFNRARELYARKLVAKAELDAATSRHDASQAQVKAAQSALDAAREQLAYTEIRAPYAGIVTQRHVQLGEAVHPGQPLISGLSLATLRVQVAVPQSAIEAIRRHQQAWVVLNDPARTRVPASHITFFPYADPQTHTFKLRLELPQQDTGLYPGMAVKTSFVTGEGEGLWLPESALVRRGEHVAVYRLSGESARLQTVRLGAARDGRVQVLAGLAAGDSVLRNASDATAGEE